GGAVGRGARSKPRERGAVRRRSRCRAVSLVRWPGCARGGGTSIGATGGGDEELNTLVAAKKAAAPRRTAPSATRAVLMLTPTTLARAVAMNMKTP
ncbi:MAG TPA: hypothetical protein VNT54_16105, partial [Solirubrobacteraceae bacterium]|nr:hypothetical protein [Solirubrobacteraceae bacterium]